jgi:ribonuclease VapC
LGGPVSSQTKKAVITDEESASTLCCNHALGIAALPGDRPAPLPHLQLVIDGSKDPIASRRFDELIEAAQIAIEPVTEAQARIARQAYRDFGKTSGHPAKLNFGDCFSYALAKSKGEPLLFKGQDFSRTDVKSARAGG